MLENDALLLFPTEDDLPDSDGKPVDNELQREHVSLALSNNTHAFFGIAIPIKPFK
jgi:hypothetical protein